MAVLLVWWSSLEVALLGQESDSLAVVPLLEVETAISQGEVKVDPSLASRLNDRFPPRRDSRRFRLRVTSAFSYSNRLTLEDAIGSPLGWSGDIDLTAGSMSAALRMEKDPFEPVFWMPESGWFGPDRVSGYVLWSRKRLSVLVGHYRMSFATGLSGDAGRLGRFVASASSAVRPGSGFRPLRSHSESGSLRGLYLSWRPAGPVTVHGAVSSDLLDAPSTEDDVFGFERMGGSGYHRTTTEIARRKSVREEIALVRTEFAARNASFALTASGLRRSYLDRQVHAALGGADGKITLGALEANGEFALGVTGSAAVASLVWRPVSDLAVVVQARRISADWKNPIGTVPLVRSRASPQESGFFAGVDFREAAWSLGASINAFRATSVRRGHPFPPYGTSARSRISYQSGEVAILASVSYRAEQEWAPEPDHLGAAGQRSRLVRSMRSGVAVNYRPVSELRLRIRAGVTARGAREHGTLLAFGCDWRPHPRIRLRLRYAQFETSDFDHAVYLHEPDFGYAFSVPALYGRGERLLGILTLGGPSGLRMSLKYTESLKRGETRQWGLKAFVEVRI